MNSEQQQRIEQIVIKHEHGGATWNDIDFLLSIVKGQEDKFDGPCVSCGHNNYDAERRECAQRWMEGRMSVVCGCPCAKHNSMKNAVNRMRSLCVEKVRASLRDLSLRFSDEGIKAAITDWTNILVKRLESLSIQEQK